VTTANTVTTASTVTAMTTVEMDVPTRHLMGWDSIELWVGNARATAGFLMAAFGFRCSAYAGPETGVRDHASYLLEQGDIRLVVTGALAPDSPIAAHVREHGDGVRNLSWRVDDVAATFDAALGRGADATQHPHREHDQHGFVVTAGVATYGETRHTFVDRSRYAARDRFGPGYSPDDALPEVDGPTVGLQSIDHVVGNVPLGELAGWVSFYEDVMGFTQLTHFDDAQISTEYSALMSTVVWDGSSITMPINEPARGRKKSQIQEYVEAYRGSGVQHIAFATDDIVATVDALRARGVRFMRVPDSYYDEARQRVPDADLPWRQMQRLNILVDRDSGGHLLQIFTETVTDRPTLFFEIIERRGAQGFGEGNFKALFEAIERDQARRGNL
jgi:4-hydroxyphenylpyruvate dioxygenase